MTSDKGQIIYPTLFESYHIEKNGYIGLTLFPGMLKHRDDTYNVITVPNPLGIGGGTGVGHTAGHDPSTYPHVRVPLNLFPATQISMEDTYPK